MRGLNIDINRSLTTQSSGSESNFVESGHKNEGLLQSLACVSDEISKQGSDNIQKLDSLVYKYEKTDDLLHQDGAVCGDPSDIFSPNHFLKMGFKDDPKSDLLKRASSGTDRYRIGNSYRRSVSNQIVDMKCDERCSTYNEHSMCMLKTPQEKSSNAPGKQQTADVSFSSTSVSPGESTCPLQRTILKDTVNIGKSFFDRTDIELNRGKGKERISQTSDTSKRFSKGHTDSYESIDSISSKRPIFLGKRAMCFEMDGNSGCTKRFKRATDEVSFPRPVDHTGGSFFNWISNVANGIPRNGLPEVSMVAVPSLLHDGRMTNSLSPLLQKKDEKYEDLDGHTGFGSFVKALYQPGIEMEQAASAMHESKYGVHHINVDQSRDNVGHNREGFKVLQSIPLSILRSHGCQLGEFPPENVQNSTSSHSPFPGTLQHVPNENHNMCTWGSTSSSMQNCSLQVTTKSSSSRFSSSGSEFLGSSWVTRLCSKPVQTVLTQLDKGESSGTEMPVFDRKHSPQIQNNYLHLEESLHLWQRVDQTDGARHQEQTSVMPDFDFTKRTQSNQKIKCKLNPIVPSPMLKKLETVTSIFAKRLNALRQIKPSAVPNAQESNLMCFFCGTTGHDIAVCPEISSSDEDLLKNIGFCNWLPVSSSICIRCFRLNHWAVACPYVAMKSKRPNDSIFRDDLVNIHSELEYDRKHFHPPGHKSQLLLKKDNLGVPCGESSNF